MLTTFDLDEAAARAIRQGASGFLLKDADPEFLLELADERRLRRLADAQRPDRRDRRRKVGHGVARDTVHRQGGQHVELPVHLIAELRG